MGERVGDRFGGDARSPTLSPYLDLWLLQKRLREPPLGDDPAHAFDRRRPVYLAGATSTRHRNGGDSAPSAGRGGWGKMGSGFSQAALASDKETQSSHSQRASNGVGLRPSERRRRRGHTPHLPAHRSPRTNTSKKKAPVSGGRGQP